MNIFPLRFRKLDNDHIIVADESGSFFLAKDEFIERYVRGNLRYVEKQFLREKGHAFDHEGDLAHMGFLSRWSLRQHVSDQETAYVILIPTLRCNLKCSYCQVSPASLDASGFDWDNETLDNILNFIDNMNVHEIQIEFQGGEPFLRLDLLEKVAAFARQRFQRVKFIVCSNLQILDENISEFLTSEDVFISTSLDGPHHIQTRNRTGHGGMTDTFLHNLEKVISLVGPERISALPTIDPFAPPDPEDLILTYEEFGFTSIYLRSINYHGFARKAYPATRLPVAWNSYYRNFIYALIQRNAHTGTVLEEFYMALCLRRIMSAGVDNHTDLRNPNIPTGTSVVIDFDGRLYPSDEARMLARIQQADLSIGHVANGLDHEKLAFLAPSYINNFDPDCIHCPYQPFCGCDPVDDLSRFGRIDVPRHTSWFCQRHLAVFDLAMELLYSKDPVIDFTLSHWLQIESIPDALRPVAP